MQVIVRTIANRISAAAEAKEKPDVIFVLNETFADISLIKDFTEYFEFGDTITEDALRARATSYLARNPLGVTAPTLTVAFEPLWKQPDYAAVLERVSLCDTVTIRHSALGITAKAKVIKTVYDANIQKTSDIFAFPPTL